MITSISLHMSLLIIITVLIFFFSLVRAVYNLIVILVTQCNTRSHNLLPCFSSISCGSVSVPCFVIVCRRNGFRCRISDTHSVYHRSPIIKHWVSCVRMSISRRDDRESRFSVIEGLCKCGVIHLHNIFSPCVVRPRVVEATDPR